MEFHLSPYSTAHFNATPSLPHALQKHEDAGGNKWVHDQFGVLFRKHKVEGMFGIALVHHHFELQHGEYLTEVRGTSTAWTSQTGTRPSLWSFDLKERSLRPLEFTMDDDDSPMTYPEWDSQQIRTFLSELFSFVQSAGVDGTYGLTLYPGDNFPGRVEMTVGRANVNLTPTQAAKHDPAHQSEAAWYFTENFRQRGCSCNCYHHGSDKSSHSHHQTVTV